MALIDFEIPLVRFVSDAVSNPFANYCLARLNLIVHHVLELGNEGLEVQEIKVDVIQSCYLETISFLDVVDRATGFYGVIEFPGDFTCKEVLTLLEKLEFARGLYN